MPNDISVKLNVDTKEGVANIELLGNKTDANMARIARAVEANNKQIAQQNRLLKEQAAAQKAAGDSAAGIEKTVAAGKAAAAAMDEVVKKTHEVSLANAGFVREMAVLFHEGVTGNFQRMLGSFIVLGERSGQLTQIVSALAGPMGAAAAAVGLFAVAAEQGHKQSEEFRRSMILTAGAAGITEGQFRSMAQAIAEQTGRGVGTAQEALQKLVASGQVAPQNIAKMGTAVVQIAHLTGESADKVAEQFQDMASDVVGWIQRHKQYADSLTASQVEAIRQMQRAGDVQGAVGVALDAINAKTADSAGFWTRLANAVGKTWEQFSHNVGGTTTAEDTVAALDKQIASIEARLERVRAHPTEGSFNDSHDQENLSLLRSQRAAAAAVASANQQAAAQRGVEQATQNAGKAAAVHLHSLAEESKGAEALKEALQHLHDEFDKVDKAGIGSQFSPELRAEMEAKIRKQHRDPGDKKEENAFNTVIKSLTDEKAKLDALTESYVRYGHSVDTTREAVLRARFSDKADELFGKGGTARGAQAIQAAQAADEASAAQKAAEHEAAIEKQVKAYLDLANAREKNAREAYIEEQLGAHGLAESEQTTEKLVDQARKLREAAGKRYDQQQAQAEARDLAKRQVAIDAEVDAINRQNDALKESTLQRQLDADKAKLQKAAEEELLKPYADQAKIQAQLAEGIERVTEARRRQYAEARDPNIRANNAAATWAEDANDAGAAAAKATTNSLDSITAAIDRMRQKGEFSFRQLWKSMADEYLHAITRMLVANTVGSGAGSFWGTAFKVGMSLLSSDGGGEDSAGMAGLAGTRAAGGNINAGGTYLVGEAGPELFRSSAAGSITPNSELSSSGGDTHYHIGEGQVINVGQGVSRAEMHQALSVSQGQTIKHVQRLTQQGKMR